MIHAIRASHESFHDVFFQPGLNVILADVTESSEQTDTRNGVGKSLLVEILHFCLAGSSRRADGVGREALEDWSFTLDLDVGPSRVEVTRHVQEPSYVEVAGDFSDWPVTPAWNDAQGAYQLRIGDWAQVLATRFFDMPAVAGQYKPSFRLVCPYFARVGRGAYLSPFTTFAGQREWQKQVAVTYLLGLAWEHAREWQEIKDQREAIKAIQKAGRTGALSDLMGTLGQLNARRVRLAGLVDDLESQLRTFEVHPQYREITDQANVLTRKLHELANENLVRSRKLESYRDQTASARGPSADEVIRLFEEAGAQLGEGVKRTLSEAQVFHLRVIEQRQSYLASEMAALERERNAADMAIEEFSGERARLLRTLDGFHALDELNALQERLAERRSALADIQSRIAQLEELQAREAQLKIDTQLLLQRAQREQGEREIEWHEAVELLAGNVRALYDDSGELIINITEAGFKFDVLMERSGSRGINNMSIFAFDLMLAQRWAGRSSSPGFLVHDSELYDGVDVRQVAAALRLCAETTREHGFQYICSLNTDDLPSEDLLEGVDIHNVLTLTDSSVEGSLFGFRF